MDVNSWDTFAEALNARADRLDKTSSKVRRLCLAGKVDRGVLTRNEEHLCINIVSWHERGFLEVRESYEFMNTYVVGTAEKRLFDSFATLYRDKAVMDVLRAMRPPARKQALAASSSGFEGLRVAVINEAHASAAEDYIRASHDGYKGAMLQTLFLTALSHGIEVPEELTNWYAS